MYTLAFRGRKVNKESLEQLAQSTSDAITNPVATGLGAGTGVLAAVYKALPDAIMVLTFLVLTCQSLAWGYKGYKWFKSTTLYKRLTGK